MRAPRIVSDRMIAAMKFAGTVEVPEGKLRDLLAKQGFNRDEIEKAFAEVMATQIPTLGDSDYAMGLGNEPVTFSELELYTLILEYSGASNKERSAKEQIEGSPKAHVHRRGYAALNAFLLSRLSGIAFPSLTKTASSSNSPAIDERFDYLAGGIEEPIHADNRIKELEPNLLIEDNPHTLIESLDEPQRELLERVKDRPDLAIACLKFLDNEVTRPEYAKLSQELTEARLDKERRLERERKARYRQRVREGAIAAPR